jgi:LacI family transcriptional regulator
MEARVSVTLKDIAKLAGVSSSTVSRSLNDSPLIPEETRRQVRKIARDLGFAFNASARSLSLGQTGTIALIFPDYFERFSINLFFSSLQSHIRTVLEKAQIDVLVAFPRNRANGESNLRKLIVGRKVDGMIIVNNEVEPDDVAALKQAGMPYVFLHKHPEDGQVPDADYFCTDHVEGGRLAARHLASRGRRNLLCVSAIGEEFDARTAGFLGGLADAGWSGAAPEVLFGDCSFEFGSREVVARLTGPSDGARVDGVFCQTDLMALGVIQGLLRAGIRVPEDVSVVGYDDIELGAGFEPSLTTVRQPLREITERACERLIERLEGAVIQPEHRLLQPSLVVRGS